MQTFDKNLMIKNFINFEGDLRALENFIHHKFLKEKNFFLQNFSPRQ